VAKQSDIKFPVAGINRRAEYPQKSSPYTTPYSRNIRGFDSLERRGRGGSRPGLSKWLSTRIGGSIRAVEKVSYVDSDGEKQTDLVILVDGLIKTIQGTTVTTNTSYLLDETGVVITTEAGDDIYFEFTVGAMTTIGTSGAYNLVEHEGRIFIADTTLRVYDPRLGTVDDITTAPSNQPLIASYLGRIVLSGEDHNYYMSRMGDPTDWDFGDDGNDVGRAVAGVTGDSGVIGDNVTCVRGFGDKAQIIASADSVWVYHGDPNAGKRICLSKDVGIIDQAAIDILDDGTAFFLSRRGVYTVNVLGSSPAEPFSKHRIPEELLDCDTDRINTMIDYDSREHGVYIFRTPIPDLLLHYKCNDNAATSVVTDSSVYGIDGTIVDTAGTEFNTSTVNVGGKINDAFDFSAGAYSIKVDDADFTADPGTFACSCWIYPTTINQINRTVFYQYQKFGLRFTNNTGTIQAVIYADGGTQDTVTTSVTVNTWWHITVTYDGFDLKIYRNSTLVDTNNAYSSFTPLDSPSTDMYFGANYVGAAEFIGYMDDIRLYGRPISEDEIDVIYNSGSGTEDSDEPATTTGESWFIELENKAFWKSVYQSDHMPISIAKMPISGDSRILLGCNDGYIRRHSHSATDDDSSNLTSDVLLGPFQLNQYGGEGQIQQLFGDLSQDSADVTWRIVKADTAEEAVDNAVSDIEAGTTTNVHSSGTFSDGHNRFKHPRTRGAWAVIWLSATGQWGYEKLSIITNKVGRQR